jgi:hypothetical protein
MKKKQFDYNKPIHDIHSYHNISVFVNNQRKNFAVSIKNKLLDVNSRFWEQCTISQKVFILEWSRRFIKLKCQYKADNSALNYIKRNNYNESEIIKLFETVSFFSSNDRKQRLWNICTESKFEYFINNIIKWKNRILNRKH